MKTYRFIKTSTAGNRTGFILGKSAWSNRKQIIAILQSKKNLEAEQFAFLWKTRRAEPYMVMAGNEISGGAILASPSILGINKKETTINIPGYKLNTIVSGTSENKIYVRVNLPKKLIIKYPETIIFNYRGRKYKGYKVVLDGIAYLVSKKPPVEKGLSLFKALNRTLNTQKIQSIGIINIVDKAKMQATVWVKKLNTITDEQACTTGTISAQLSFPNKTGRWEQASKEKIRAKTGKSIIIEAGVEVLSEGKLYLTQN